MNKNSFYALWGGMFILCAALGFIPEPEGALRIALIILSVLFFAPGAALLHYADKTADSGAIRTVRNICTASLVLTLVGIVTNILSVELTAAAGDVLYVILVIISTPMIAAQYWVLSMFLWACLLMWSVKLLKKTRAR